ENNVKDFLRRIYDLNKISEIIFIDDGSYDNTLSTIKKYQEIYSEKSRNLKITLLELTRQFGKESAILAGIDYINLNCDALILIDSDLQHPPEKINEMIEAWNRGFEIISAVRDDRKSDPFLRGIFAKIFYKIFNGIVDKFSSSSGIGDFCLISSKVVQTLTEMREYNRFSKGLLPWTGFKHLLISYHHDFRNSGNSSWNFLKLFDYALDGIFSFSIIPLKIWTFIGLSMSSASISYGLYLVIMKLIIGKVSVPGYTSIMTTLLFLGGLNLIGIGVLGDYVGRIYLETKKRPHYIVRSISTNLDINKEA
ncbi:glycosyltransferase family 2 protein, partial [Prochlorococcus sp. AH-716-B04]|nr:glycosyltransferase family 2 protein [Prochlorococcus sp. AH-716-B04]